jgi:antirestriction protein ArdC
MTKTELAAEALSRARGSLAVSNYPAIFAAFIERGIPEADILPRENVLTYHAWRALGRTVKRGEHGVKILTWVARESPEADRNPDSDAEPKSGRRYPKTATVFHVSQTTELVGHEIQT